VPATDVGGSDGSGLFHGSTKLQQFGPCDVVLDIPAPAYDAYCTAITGWYDQCVDPGPTSDDDLCAAGNYMALDKPLFIDLNTCYENPELPAHSVSFFAKSKDGIVSEFHLIFSEGKGRTSNSEQLQGERSMCMSRSAHGPQEAVHDERRMRKHLRDTLHVGAFLWGH
jgi:hypothetical protein